MYSLLVESNKSGDIDFSGVTTFNLDEYIGVAEDHPMSYRTYMNEKLFSKININMLKTHVPLTEGADIKKKAEAYDKAIEYVGGIDLQVLGIGVNGHIAFNEPGSTKDDMTRIVKLTESTIKSNARYFESIDYVPDYALTMGIGSILKAKKIILIASGVNKAQAIKDTVEGKISSDVPASFLQVHDNVTLIIDEDAASLLTFDDSKE